MPIEIRHERDHGIDAALAFLLSRQQAAKENAAQQPQFRIPTYQELVAMQQAQQPPGAVAAGAPSSPGSGPAGAPVRGGGPAPVEPQRSGLRPNLAGLRFIEQQNQIALGFANQQNQQLHDQALTERQLQMQQIEAQQQAQNAAAINQRQQEQAELQANLAQRNKLMQTAPGVIDPETLMNVQGRVQANREALTWPARQARQKLLEAIATGDPEAIQEGLRQGLLAFSPEQLTRIRSLREAMAQKDLDQSLSPAQRAMAERHLAEQLNAIRPMEVPSNEQPKDPLEQYHEGTITYPHETSGIPITKQRVIRNGEEKWELTDESKEDLKIWGEKEVKKWEQQNGYGAHDPEIKRQELEYKQKEMQDKRYHDAFTKKMEAQGKLNELKLSILDAKKQLAVAKATAEDPVDDVEAQAVLTELEEQAASYQAYVDHYDTMMDQGGQANPATAGGYPGMGSSGPLGSAPPQQQPMPTPPQQQQPMPGGNFSAWNNSSPEPPEWYLKLDPGTSYIDPAGIPRIKQ